MILSRNRQKKRKAQTKLGKTSPLLLQQLRRQGVGLLLVMTMNPTIVDGRKRVMLKK